MQFQDGLIRTDHMIDGGVGKLFLREVRTDKSTGKLYPVLLVHGARVPGIPSFDLPVPGGSLAGDLAKEGLQVFIGDIRGYGQSDRPSEMQRAPETSRPLVRAPEAARDIESMIEWIVDHTNQTGVSLLGWATGGMWSGYLAANRPEVVDRLVLYNALYRSPNHPALGLGSELEDPDRPGHFNERLFGGYRFNEAASLLGAWDNSIPSSNLASWRDPDVAASYVDLAIRSDAGTADRNPPAFRAPSGALQDSFFQASGRQLYDASLIDCPTLIVAGERDFWSQPVDREEFVAHARAETSVRVDVIPNATHFIHLDRPESGRDVFFRSVVEFLENTT